MDDTAIMRELHDLRQMLTWLIDETVAIQVNLHLLQTDLRDVHHAVSSPAARARKAERPDAYLKLLELEYGKAAKRAKKLGLDDLYEYLSE